jgi:DNA-binding transcriptional LysR family regulator
MKPIDHLPGLFAFERVVALGSLTAAAGELGLSLAVASKRLASLEHRMGVRLINRSTRRLSVTDAGKLLHGHAVRVVTELSDASDALARQRREISGLLKITAPHGFGRRRLVPLLGQFSRASAWCRSSPSTRWQKRRSMRSICVDTIGCRACAPASIF